MLIRVKRKGFFILSPLTTSNFHNNISTGAENKWSTKRWNLSKTPCRLLPKSYRRIRHNATTDAQTPQTFNVQQVENARVGVQQQPLATLHRDVVAILWHSSREPAVSPRPPPAEPDRQAALQKSLVRLLFCFVLKQDSAGAQLKQTL